jgi:hypothetical protein
VQSSGEGTGARDWEIENGALQRAGVINDAELGMANLKQAMRDPSLLADIASGLRTPEGQVELSKMLANPNFQEQMKALIDANGALGDFLTLEFYAKKQEATDSNAPGSLASLLLALNPVSARSASTRTDVRMETKADLKVLAQELNPTIGFVDPLEWTDKRFWGWYTGMSEEFQIGWLRHAEIKHGRVAMAGFVGYCIHENGIRWPWPLTTSMPDYSSFEGLSAPDVWDALPSASKLQILIVIGFFEFWSENSWVLEQDGQKHYTKGGKPGYFPTFKKIPHPVPFNLFDPFGFTKNLSEEQKAKGLQKDINNGRLAMLGLMSLVSEAKMPGSVPFLKGLIKQYDGQPMAPFSKVDEGLAYVKWMNYFDSFIIDGSPGGRPMFY